MTPKTLSRGINVEGAPPDSVSACAPSTEFADSCVIRCRMGEAAAHAYWTANVDVRSPIVAHEGSNIVRARRIPLLLKPLQLTMAALDFIKGSSSREAFEKELAEVQAAITPLLEAYSRPSAWYVDLATDYEVPEWKALTLRVYVDLEDFEDILDLWEMLSQTVHKCLSKSVSKSFYVVVDRLKRSEPTQVV